MMGNVFNWNDDLWWEIYLTEFINYYGKCMMYLTEFIIYDVKYI